MPNSTSFTEDLAREILDRIAEGETLTSICRSQGSPSYRTVRRWRDNRELILGDMTFAEAYDRARRDQAYLGADELIDDSDVIMQGDKWDSARIQAAKLKTDTKKWIVSKVLNSEYGTRIQHAGEDDNATPIVIIRKVLPDEPEATLT